MTKYSRETLNQYKRVTTATITTVLLKKGIKNVWIRGAFPLADDQTRVVGPAFTLRFVPMREDLATPASWSSPNSTRGAVEAMPSGAIAVVGTDRCIDAGIFGDILCQRMKNRGVAALVTDGVIRDLEGIRTTGLNVWTQGVAAPAAVAGLTFVGWQQAVGCGGVAVFPDDLIVADKDGAVVIPVTLVDEVLAAALEQEELEQWILEEIREGAVLTGLYPPNEENRRRFEEARNRS